MCNLSICRDGWKARFLQAPSGGGILPEFSPSPWSCPALAPMVRHLLQGLGLGTCAAPVLSQVEDREAEEENGFLKMLFQVYIVGGAGGLAGQSRAETRPVLSTPDCAQF